MGQGPLEHIGVPDLQTVSLLTAGWKKLESQLLELPLFAYLIY